MAKKAKPCLLKLEQSLTAFDVQKELDQLVQWLGSLVEDGEAMIDASTIQKIDTAGCQFIDMAITAGKKKCKQLHLDLSPMVLEGFKALGVDHDA